MGDWVYSKGRAYAQRFLQKTLKTGAKQGRNRHAKNKLKKGRTPEEGGRIVNQRASKIGKRPEEAQGTEVR